MGDESSPNATTPTVLAVSSGGGHWVQLQRILPALEGLELVVASVEPSASEPSGVVRSYSIPDATRWNKFGLVKLAWRILSILLRERPDVVISTGAAPGYIALRLAKILGARTIWVDSIANVERLSLSGQKVRAHADLWLTQWEHLADEQGPQYHGSVI